MILQLLLWDITVVRHWSDIVNFLKSKYMFLFSLQVSKISSDFDSSKLESLPLSLSPALFLKFELLSKLGMPFSDTSVPLPSPSPGDCSEGDLPLKCLPHTDLKLWHISRQVQCQLLVTPSTQAAKSGEPWLCCKKQKSKNIQKYLYLTSSFIFLLCPLLVFPNNAYSFKVFHTSLLTY